jgi:hypothetical protein
VEFIPTKGPSSLIRPSKQDFTVPYLFSSTNASIAAASPVGRQMATFYSKEMCSCVFLRDYSCASFYSKVVKDHGTTESQPFSNEGEEAYIFPSFFIQLNFLTFYNQTN